MSDLWNSFAVHAEKGKVHWYSIKGPGQNTSLELQVTWKGLRMTIFVWSSGYFIITGSEKFIPPYYFMDKNLIFFKGVVEMCMNSGCSFLSSLGIDNG